MYKYSLTEADNTIEDEIVALQEHPEDVNCVIAGLEGKRVINSGLENEKIQRLVRWADYKGKTYKGEGKHIKNFSLNLSLSIICS